MWRASASGDGIEIFENSFAQDPSLVFPLSQMTIKRVVDDVSVFENKTPAVKIRVENAVLSMNEDGTPSSRKLIFEDKNQNEGVIKGSNHLKAHRTETGYRYYSQDNKFMLSLTHDPIEGSMAVYFDVSDPNSPRTLWTKAHDKLIRSAAVCDDGRLVAIEYGKTEKTVSVFDSQGRLIDTPLSSHGKTDGIMWRGKFLFIGIQDHPYPAGIHIIPTRDIQVFNYESAT